MPEARSREVRGARLAWLKHGRRPYVVAWLALVLLTGSSYVATHLGISGVGFGVALGVAAIKASIVGFVFMHLHREYFTVRFLALVNVLWIILICLGIYSDLGAR